MYSVTGNLFHHSVEMFLKGSLVKGLSEKQRRGFGHDLVALWNEYKATTGDSALSQFDQMIRELNEFEDIRYPDDIVKSGMILQIAFDRASVDPAFANRTAPPRAYILPIDHIDGFVEMMFQKANINPAYFINSLGVGAQTALRQWNKSTLGTKGSAT